jgi:hypothetical protein
MSEYLDEAHKLNIRSWRSALSGLVVLAKQNKLIWLDKGPVEDVAETAKNKKNIKEALRFIKKVIKRMEE